MSAAHQVSRVVDVLLGPSLLRSQRRRGAGAVLLYHRVGPETDRAYPPLPSWLFEWHCRLVARHFRVLPLDEFATRARQNKTLAGCCAITFDDGYHDFLEHAYPILRAHQLPVTHFLVVNSLLSGRPPWNMRVRRLKVGARSLPDEERATLGLDEAFLASIDHKWGAMDAPEREAALVDVESKLDLPPEPAMMSVEELKKCDGNLVEWGSHTVSHASLGLCREQTARAEIADSREQLQHLTGAPIRFISYPNGFYSPQVLAAARDSGYLAGTIVGQREVPRACDPFALPRIDIASTSRSPFVMEVSGATEQLRHKIGRGDGLRAAGK